jgi:hypothetical protein
MEINLKEDAEECITLSQVNLIFNSRIFWRRFTTWIRVYIISRFAGIGTAEDAFGRLYLEASEFGPMLRLIFGRNLSNTYETILRRFTIGLRELISAQLNGDAEAVRQQVNDLYRLTDESAAFLASINPYLDEAEWRNMFATYLQYTIEEANLFIMGDYSKDIGIFDRLTELTNRMGDLFAKTLYDYITSAQQCEDSLSPRQCITYDEMNRIYDIRMVWFEMATWIRAYMLSRYAGLGEQEEILARLKQVPVRYTDMMKQVFSEKDVESYRQLFDTYLDLIVALISAHMANDTDEVNRITQLLYRNADERAAFLASVNPFWTEEEWRTRLYDNIRSTIDESTSFLAGGYAVNLDIFSTLLDQAENNSDYYARGLFQYVLNSRS